MAKPDEKGIEGTLSRIEAIVDKLENEEISLESAMEAFEQGIQLTRSAHTNLEQAEQRVQLLIEENGEPIAELPDGNGE